MKILEDLGPGFPPAERDNYHEGLGDLAPVDEPTFGRRRVVFRVPVGCERVEAEAKAKSAGVVYQDCFATARYWVFTLHD